MDWKILLIFGLLLLSGCESKEDWIELNLETSKSVYKIYEDFDITLTKKYYGEPFGAVIIYEGERIGYDRKFREGYVENISSDDFKRYRGSVGYPLGRAFNIHDCETCEDGYWVRSPIGYFDEEGTYKISVYLYNCSFLEEKGLECDYDRNNVHGYKNINLTSDDIGINDPGNPGYLTEVLKPQAFVSKMITVRGGEDPTECETMDDCPQPSENNGFGSYLCGNQFDIPRCIECNRQCKEGFYCDDNKCIEDECSSDEDCIKECEGCNTASQMCYGGRCMECKDYFDDESCKEGYDCRDWGCTDREIMLAQDKCLLGDICEISENRRYPETECTMVVVDYSPEGRCLECERDIECEKGLRCYDYECVGEEDYKRLIEKRL